MVVVVLVVEGKKPPRHFSHPDASDFSSSFIIDEKPRVLGALWRLRGQALAAAPSAHS